MTDAHHILYEYASALKEYRKVSKRLSGAREAMMKWLEDNPEQPKVQSKPKDTSSFFGDEDSELGVI